jgi:hypothetical protein
MLQATPCSTEDSCRYHHQCCKQRLVRRPCGEALPPYQRESTRNGRSHRQRCSMHRPVPHPCVESVESPTSHQRDTLSVRRRAEATISEAASNAMFLAIATKHRLLTSARARRRAAATNNDATCTAMFEAHAPKHQRLAAMRERMTVAAFTTDARLAIIDAYATRCHLLPV